METGPGAPPPGPPGTDPAPAHGRGLAGAVADLFRAELGAEEYAVDDSFFRVGGSSLAAMRVVAQLREQYGVRVGLADVFDNPTPAGLAERLAELGVPGADPAAAVTPGRPRADDTAPLSYSQEGFFEVSRAVGAAPFFNMVGQLRFVGEVDPVAVKSAVTEVARRQGALRTCFDAAGGQPVQRTVDRLPRVEEVDLRPDGGRRLRRLLAREQATGLALTDSPPVRFTLARTGDDAWSLVWTVHHIVFDGVSETILSRELSHAYQVALGGAVADAAPARSYLDFARWQRETLTGERLAGHLAAVADLLGPAAPPIAPGTGRGFTTRLETFDVGEADAAGLRRCAATLGVSLFVLLVAVAADFARARNGASRQLVGVQSANRGWPGSETLIGCFANTLCVPVRVEAGWGREERVAAARAGLAAALRHEELPMELALRLLAERGGTPHRGMPQLGLVLLPDGGGPVQLPGCRVEPVPVVVPGDYLDPTTVPLVVELAARGGELRGVTHRLLDAWTPDSFAEAMGDLTRAFRSFAAEPA